MEDKGNMERARIAVNTAQLDMDVSFVLRRFMNISQDTYAHALNVGYMVAEILCDKCCREYELIEVTKGALIHDVGKIWVPEGILNKTKSLNIVEMREMRTHPIKGKEYLEDIFNKTPSAIVRDIVYKHHEKGDGSGYPEGIVDIPWYVELVSTVDAYDAMTARRCYGRERKSEEAIEVLIKENFPKTYIEDIARLTDK